MISPAFAGEAVDWSWRLESTEFMHSEIAITRADESTRRIEFPCSLEDVLAETIDEETASVDVVNPDSYPGGLLVVICNVGAHSVQISVIDPNSDGKNEDFVRTGSYFARWDIRRGRLRVHYDQPCGSLCESGFETQTVVWPARVELSRAEAPFADFLASIDSAVTRRDREFVEARIAPEFYFDRDHGGMFVEGESAVFNFNQVFVLDNLKLSPEYHDDGWNRLATFLDYDQFEAKGDGELCAPYGATHLKPYPVDQLCFERSETGIWHISGFVGGGD
jgi:hypothetical protein